jgi:hypothetical protein
MKFTWNDDTVFDSDRFDTRVNDLLHRFAPFANFSQESLGHYDDFALRSLLRRLSARRDTLNDAIEMVHAEEARRQNPPSSLTPEKL